MNYRHLLTLVFFAIIVLQANRLAPPVTNRIHK